MSARYRQAVAGAPPARAHAPARARRRTRWTVAMCHLPPCRVGTPRAFSAATMARIDMPSDLSLITSSMTRRSAGSSTSRPAASLAWPKGGVAHASPCERL